MLKFRHLVGAVVAAAIISTMLTTLVHSRQENPFPADMKKQWERYLDTCKIKPAHGKLAPMVGDWDVTTSLRMPGSGKVMETTKGTATYRWLHEGRWLQGTWKGTMMNKPMISTSITGYDVFKKRYVVAMVSDATTNMLTSSGAFDVTGKNLLLYGDMDEPMTDEQDKLVKYVWRFQGADKMTLEVHDLSNFEAKSMVMEHVYVRRKS